MDMNYSRFKLREQRMKVGSIFTAIIIIGIIALIGYFLRSTLNESANDPMNEFRPTPEMPAQIDNQQSW